jgi:hypothetical protein
VIYRDAAGTYVGPSFFDVVSSTTTELAIHFDADGYVWSVDKVGGGAGGIRSGYPFYASLDCTGEVWLGWTSYTAGDVLTLYAYTATGAQPTGEYRAIGLTATLSRVCGVSTMHNGSCSSSPGGCYTTAVREADTVPVVPPAFVGPLHRARY